MTKTTIGFVGAGNMALSLAGGLLAANPDVLIVAADPSAEQRSLFKQRLASDRVEVFENNQALGRADVLMLAVKPQVLRDVSIALAPALSVNTLVISIAAGISLSALQSWYGEQQPIVRAMPNTPALVRCGATGAFGNEAMSSDDKAVATQVLSAVGSVHWVSDEKQIDFVTAVSGSGPAYFFLLMEAMTQVGAEMGLDLSLAEALSVQTCLGAGQLAADSDYAPGELRRMVTSPGGTTAAAIEQFEQHDLVATVRQAMQSCADRAAEMALEFGQ